MKKFTGRRLTVIAAGLSVVLAAGVAFAAWTASGTGAGYAKSKTAAPLTTVDASADTSPQLYPTGSGDLILKVHNPNDYNVTITTVTGNGTIVSGNATCDASNGVTFTDQTGLALVATHNTDTEFTLAGTVHMSNASVDACQTKVFTVPVSLAGASS